MEIAVWGAGAIGGITGACLVRAGHDVTFVDIDAEHVAAMAQGGLTIEKQEGGFRVGPVRAITPDRFGGPANLVLLAVKAVATPGAIEQIAPHLADGGAVVSLQNGLNEEVIAARIGPHRTVGALVNWAADYQRPGVIQHGGEGSLILGELDGRITERVRGLADLLSAVCPVPVTDNIWGYLWAKTCFGALLFATALVDAPVYEIVERSPAVQRTLADIVIEAMGVAEAWGVRLLPFDEFDPALFRAAAAGDAAPVEKAMATIAAHYRRHTKVKTGVWRDLAVRKRRTEVDAQVGVIVTKGAARGIPTPLASHLIELIHDLEGGRGHMAWENLDSLGAVAR
jgi:2-dehydropantoate 2-reductase